MFQNFADIFMHNEWIQSNFFWWQYSIFSKLSTISWVLKKKKFSHFCSGRTSQGSQGSQGSNPSSSNPGFEIKKTKNFMKLEYISYKMIPDYKKKLKFNKIGARSVY